jgi:hypothetical protein
MRKFLLLTFLSAVISTSAFSQADRFWSPNNSNRSRIVTDKAVARLSYPKDFRLFNLDLPSFRQELMSVVGTRRVKPSTIITIPNADGGIEQFEIMEASNFEPELQARFPEIRAYTGKGITDKYATLKLSISPKGVQTMVFRTEKENEFIEAYSQDHTVYSVYKAQREKGNLPWTCTTDDKQMMEDMNAKVSTGALARGSSSGQLKTLRLALSCNGEYANYFKATSSSQADLVLAAFNETLTRCNGVFERDLALHLNLIESTTSVIYYNPSTDPYTTLSSWNLQLQRTLTNVIGNSNYDIGHMFGASGGGGNAGCIGCVCVNPATSSSLGKGSGITSPADGVPKGDNFDIDYVAHEIGHQLGANHTFSMSLEGTGQNKEVGSGITVMGYAGITSQDVAPHSIDIFHATSIAQIQANLVNKTCPVSTDITANNAPPAIAAVTNYTIPISTPFALTASATDANGDALTYCWEQNDNATTSGTGSVASPTKTTGPNWLSFPPTSSPTRSFPRLETILSGLMVTPRLPGGDASANIEALSSVSRTLNFRLTVRDNHLYRSTAPVAVGQTAYVDMVVNVTNTAGPFRVTAPNTNVSWPAGGSATVTWDVNNTNTGTVNCTAVNILLSTDGGNTFPTVLVASTPNDGSQDITVPSTPGATNRIKVEAVGNIFFDISNTNFTIGTAAACGDPVGLTATSITQTSATVSWSVVSGGTYTVEYKQASASSWATAITGLTTTSINLTGLTPNTVYDWRVRATCASGTGNYVVEKFTTASAASTCPGSLDGINNGTVSGAATIPFNTDVFGLINVKGDNDYYKFEPTTSGPITISLASLPADYQLSLLGSDGKTVIQSSTNSGTTSESISENVDATKIYYVRVYPRNNGAMNASSCYTLRVQSGTAARMSTENVVTGNGLNVSPNPAGSRARLAFTSPASGTATLSVIDQSGAVVLRKKLAVSAGNNNHDLDLSSLANGSYFMRLQSGATVQMTRLVVAK